MSHDVQSWRRRVARVPWVGCAYVGHVCTEKPAACPRSVRDENRADSGSTGRGMVIREIVDRVSCLACDGGKVAAAATFFISKRNEAIVDVARLFC